MRLILFISSLLFLIISCRSTSCTCEIDTEIHNRNTDLISNYYRNPINLPSQFWYNFKEPNMYKDEVVRIRLLVQNRITKQGFVYRLEQFKNEQFLIVKEFSIDYHTNEFQTSSIDTFHMSKVEWDSVIDHMNSNCYYNLASDISEDENFPEGMLHILEFKNINKICSPSNYNLILRISPDIFNEYNLAYNEITKSIFRLRK